MLEFKKQVLKQNTEQSRAFTQITLDDDCIVKDSKPDVIKIIHTKGAVVFDETKISGQTVWVTGKLNFTVLYRSDGRTEKLESLQDSITFGERLVMEGLDELDTVRLSGKLEDLSISVINSRKLAVRALIDISGMAEHQSEEEWIDGIMPEGVVQERREEKEMLLLVSSKKDLVRTHNEIPLPGAHPNISRILYDHVEVRNREVVMAKGHVQLQGEAYCAVLYMSEDGQNVWYECCVPIAGQMECEEYDGQPIYWIHATPSLIEVEAVADFDGEMRLIGVDMTFDVDMKVWKEKTMPILTDVYALDCNLIPRYDWMNTWKLQMKNISKLRISEQVSLEDGQEKILQLCCQEGEVHIDQVTVVDNGISVEGILMLHVLYATADDNVPVAKSTAQIPFVQMIDVPGLTALDGKIHYELETGIDQLQVNLLDSDKYEVKATLSLGVIVLTKEQSRKIVELTEEPFDEEALQKAPGIVGYVVKDDEEMWDVAKQYHTTEQEIMNTNGLKSPRIKRGDKLIIVKKVG